MARLTDRQFLKAQIDLEPLGLIMDGPFEAYFCTPKGARIFARSGSNRKTKPSANSCRTGP